MCELFGLCSNKDVSISFSWHGFVKRGRKHRDGWGVAWYVPKFYRGKYIGMGVALVKEPRPSVSSPVAKLLEHGIRSNIVISHVRLATSGEPSYVNTHPFVRLLNGVEWVFAHNGSVEGVKSIKLTYYHPAGETDSEHAFCYIMDNLVGIEEAELFENILSIVNDVSDYGSFNFLMSNGTYLFAHTNDGRLYYLLRHPPHRGYARLIDDEDFRIHLGEMKSDDEFATLIATKPLTDENWIQMDLEKLYVFRDGDLVLKVGYEGMEVMLSDLDVDVLKIVRSSPHAVKLSEIADSLGVDVEEVSNIVQSLVARNYLKKHSRDKVPSDHPDARYFTKEDKRELIDLMIKVEN